MSVKVLSGSKTIGGNCIIVNLNKDEYLVLDHGLNFSMYRKYYGNFIQPLDADELRALKVVPDSSIVLNAKEVFITHLHLDHLGSLDYLDSIEDEKPRVYIPSKKHYVEAIVSSWRQNWKYVLIPHQERSKELIRDVEENPLSYVKPLKVYHSAYPSYLYIVETDNGIVVYTGDFRMESLLRPLLSDPLAEEVFRSFYGEPDYNPFNHIAEEVGQMDVLVAEGTNFSRPLVPLEPGDFIAIIERLLSLKMPTVVVAHPSDIESVIAIALITHKQGLQAIIYSSRIARLISDTVSSNILGELNLYYTGKAFRPTLRLQYISLDEAIKRLMNREAIVITDYEAPSIARILVNRSITYPVIGLILSSEPTTEEYSIEMQKHLEWFKLAKIQPYRLRVSGHYYPHEFKEIITTIRPGKLIPVHTTVPNVMLELFNRYSSSVAS